LGEIGYTAPEAVLDALEPLQACLKEGDRRAGVIFALGCVGYTRPEFVEGLIPRFQACSQRASPGESWACYNALKKIGMETDCLLRYALAEKRTLAETMEILFERMIEYESGLVDESIDAVKSLADKFPKDMIIHLNQKLEEIHREPKRTRHLAQNITITTRELTKKFSSEMRETVPLMVAHFRKGRFESYRTLDSSAIALKTIFQKHPEFMPTNIVETLNSFLKDEKRFSVVLNTKELLEEVKKHI